MKRVFASSYQAVSGTGAQAIEELEAQIRDWASADRKWDDVRLAADKVKVYPHQIAFNALPHVDSFLDSGYTKEEMKMENEGRKIMHHPGFRASVTCVRVPVFRAHSVAVSAEFEKPVTVAEARAVLAKAPGLDVVDDPRSSSIRWLSMWLARTTAQWAAFDSIAPSTTASLLDRRRPAPQRSRSQCGADR